MLKIYSYLLDHDLGLAPNPFGRFCTLAVCKPAIRKSGNLALGDWIIGTGSKSLEEATGKKLTGKLIYAMRITDRIPLENYWADSRFQYKKPVISGTLVTMFGDNFYHKDPSGNWIQEDSAHSNYDGTVNLQHLEVDTSGTNVLISEHFYYFGDDARTIPEELKGICHSTQGQKIIDDQDLVVTFSNWISSFRRGVHGKPLNWCEYDQLSLF